MLASTGMQHSSDRVEQHGGSGVNVCSDDVPTAAEPTLSLLELARPHRYGRKRPQRWGEHLAIAEAVAIREF
jgi:hypothetical protein